MPEMLARVAPRQAHGVKVQVALRSVPKTVPVSLHLFARGRSILEFNILSRLDNVNIVAVEMHCVVCV